MVRLAGESPRIAHHIKLSPPGTDDPVILCYEDIRGEGPPLVLLPGLGDTVWIWHRLIPLLPSGQRIIALEPRGQGRSASPKGPYTLDMLSGDLRKLIERLGLARPVLIGQGLGARVAILFAIENPELPSGLILTAADAGPPKPFFRSTFTKRIQNAEIGDMGEAYKSLKAVGGLPRGMSPKERAEHHRNFLANMPEGYTAVCRALLNAPDLTPRLGEIRCPVLVLAGSEDEERVESAQVLAARIPDCEALIIEGAKRNPSFEQAGGVATQLNLFLQKHGLFLRN
ncbi:MAG: alpha/beta hydrolase [bacterium]|nr:alpha/beta hydrolase [bacterium]